MVAHAVKCASSPDWTPDLQHTAVTAFVKFPKVAANEYLERAGLIPNGQQAACRHAIAYHFGVLRILGYRGPFFLGSDLNRLAEVGAANYRAVEENVSECSADVLVSEEGSKHVRSHAQCKGLMM